MTERKLKVALVQDWLTALGGAEKVFSELLRLFPEADIYTLVASDKIVKSLGINGRVTQSFICHLPFAQKLYRKYLQFFPMAIEGFDFAGYDLIISSSSSVAKGVLTSSCQTHICYCHSPARYVWDLCGQYLRESGLHSRYNPLAFYARRVLHKFRIWDVVSANRVDYFIANSNYIAKRISKIYRRDSVVIYPPVRIDMFRLNEEKRDDYYFTVSRMVQYKKVDLIVRAFAQMPDKQLFVAGTGPDMKKIQKIATPNVHLLGYVPEDKLREYIAKAKAFVFAADEDFGIAPVEAQATGTPVICYGKGGVLETVVDGVTGLFFKEQTEASLIDAVHKFEKMTFVPSEIRRNAERFSAERFRQEIADYVEKVCVSTKEEHS